jgi:pilus assembly protein CpaD
MAMTLCLAIWAAGCASTPKPVEVARNTEAPNSIVVSETTSSHTVRYQTGVDEPDAAQIIGLNDFLIGADVERGDRILIERAASPADDMRASILADALARKGLQPAMSEAASVPPGELRLVIQRYVATAPGCPNWTKPPGNDFDNTLHSDFGCATASNLAAMVADPHDLLSGRSMGPPSGEPALAAMQRYLAGKTTPLPSESASAPATAAGPATP